MRELFSARIRRSLCGLAAVVACLAGPIARGQVSSEKSLPPSTLLYIKIAKASDMRDALNASSIGRILADPALKPMLDQWNASLEEGNLDLRKKLGVSFEELVTLPQGAVSIALVTKDDPKDPVALLASADAGEKADAMAAVLDKATKSAEEEGSKILTETFQDQRLTIIESVKEGEDKESPVIWTRSGSVFHIASDATALKELLTNAQGRSDALGTSEGFQAVTKRIGSDAQVLIYGDFTQIFKLATAASANQGVNAEQVEAQLQLLGLNSLKSIGASVSFNAGEYDSVTKVFVYAPGPVQGVVKLFTLPKAELKPEPWVPAAVASYASYSWDLDSAWVGAKELADQFAPGILDNLEQQLAGEDGKGLSFKNDIFGPLGNRITVLSDYKKPITEKSQRYLLGVRLDDAKAFQASLNKILELAMAQPKKREFQGITIYDFEIPELPEDAPPAEVPFDGPISLAIAKDYLLIGSEPQMLEQALRSGGPSLADSPEYQRVAKKLPSSASIVSFDRTDENARMLYEMIKSGQLKQSLEEANAAAGAEAPKIDLDTSKLPDFEVIAKYLCDSGGYGEVIEGEGFFAIQFSLKKEAP
jgi:hypothetical protein